MCFIFAFWAISMSLGTGDLDFASGEADTVVMGKEPPDKLAPSIESRRMGGP
jgi:hypothetical protein